MSSSLRLSAFAVLCLFGCAEGGGNGGDGGEDGGGRRDTGVDSGGPVCGAGQHACGDGCIDDLANEPANGCTYGCGEPCPTPPDGVAMCGSDGFCVFGCEPPFHQEGTMCVCTPSTCDELGFECGSPDDGCGGTLNCMGCPGAAICDAGHCACAPDDGEPNDSRSEADGQPDLGAVPNETRWTDSFDTFNLDNADDEDWFALPVTDTGANNPVIAVTLSNIPAGGDFELAAYYVCNSGNHNSTCDVGASDNTLATGCSSTNSGNADETLTLHADCDNFLSFDDSGTLYIRVYSYEWAAGSCQNYNIGIVANN